MSETAKRHGISLDGQAARQFKAIDFERFDHIFVMDKSNLNDVLYLDDDSSNEHTVRLFREFDPEPDDYQVPDPYYGGTDGFENVFAIVDRTCDLMLHRLVEEYELAG